jgi:alkylhydroperoxidase family enzyme
MATYLAPIEKPRGLLLKLTYYFTRRMFGKVSTPIAVFSARMPTAFLRFYGKVSSLDKKLTLPRQTAILVRERVASINGCLYCMDASRWYALTRSPDAVPKLDALADYQTSSLFSSAERAALDYVSELVQHRNVSPGTFAELSRHYTEREICDIVWLVASEHVYNMTNIGLGIGSDGMCELRTRRGAPATAQAPAP